MIETILIYTILGILIFLSNISNKILVFLIVFMSSGFIYLSASSLLIYLSYVNFRKFNPSFLQLFFFCLICLLVFISSVTNINTGFSFFELTQFFIVCALFLFVRFDLFNVNDFKSIPIGFFIGSIVISLVLIYRNFILNDLSQDNFEFFSISQTYNYTSYYLTFGLIFSSYMIFNSFFIRFMIFMIYCLAIYSLESRAGLLIGLLSFIFISINHDSFLKLFIGIIPFAVILIFIINSSIFDSTNQNDLLFSIINFEDNTSNLERINMFLGSFMNLSDYPFGVGLDNTHIGLALHGVYHPHSHNTLANWVYDFGYLGIFLYSFFLFFLMREFLKSFGLKRKVSKVNYAMIGYLFFYSIVSSLQYNIMVTLITYFCILTLVSFSRVELISSDNNV